MPIKSVFGMHLFDNALSSVNQRNFYITTVLVSILTYCFAIIAVWVIAPDEQKIEM